MMSKSKQFHLIRIHFLVENFFEKNFILLGSKITVDVTAVVKLKDACYLKEKQ